MKKVLLLGVLLLLGYFSEAQNISYAQLNDLFNLWKDNKGVSTLPIINKLHDLSGNWGMRSHGIEKETRYYAYTAAESKTDSAAVAIYIEEDDTSVKYSLRYAFHDRALYLSMQQCLVGSGNYNGRITYLDNKSQREFTTTALSANNQPDSIPDILMTEMHNQTPNLYIIDISSRYIRK